MSLPISASWLSNLEAQLALLPTEQMAWSLVHFLWQGLLIALLCAVALRGLRSSSSGRRYAVTVAGMVSMAILPVLTTLYLVESAASPGPVTVVARHAQPAAVEAQAAPSVRRVVTPAATPVATPAAAPAPVVTGALAVLESLRGFIQPHLRLLFGLWLLGAGLLAMTHAGGVLRIQKLRRQATPVGRWAPAIRRLGSRLGIRRQVPLLESSRVPGPLVIGWLKPAILVPPAAFAGLAPQQLEAILVHELAHIRRHDYLVNLLQVTLETLLFYHPAVWWLSGQARLERELCCDDLAVAVTGEPLVYARALALVEEMRPRTPILALGADGGSLLGRIERLVTPRLADGDDDRGRQRRNRHARPAGPASLGALVVAVLVAVLIAGTGASLVGGGTAIAEPAEDPVETGDWVAEEARRLESRAAGTPWAGLERRRTLQLARWGFDPELFQALQAAGIKADGDDLEALARAGVEARDLEVLGSMDLDAGSVAELAHHGVDADEIAELRALGIELEAKQLLMLARHGVDADDIAEWRAAGYETLSTDQMITLARHGLDADDVAELSAAGYRDLSVEQLAVLARHGIDGDDVAELSAAGYRDLSVEQLTQLARHGIDGDDIAELSAAGYRDLSVEQLAVLARHGIDGDDVAELSAAGYRDLSVEELTHLARHGVDGDDIAELVAAGYQGLSVEDLAQLGRLGIDGDDVAELSAAGYRDLSVEQLTQLARHGVDGDDIAELVAAGYRDLSVEDLADLARHGVDGGDVAELTAAGLRDLSVEQLVDLARHGVDGDDVAELSAAGLRDLSVEQLVDLARHGIGDDELEAVRKSGRAVDFETVMSMARSGELWHLDHDHHEHGSDPREHGSDPREHGSDPREQSDPREHESEHHEN